MSVPPSGPYIPQIYNASDPDVKVSDMQAALTNKQDAAAFLTTLVGIGGTSGSGNLARATSPTFVTPTLGAAAGTSLVLSGTATASGFYPAATQSYFTANCGIQGTFQVASASQIGWANSSNPAGSTSLCFTQQSAGVVQIGTTAANALGSLACASATLSTALNTNTINPYSGQTVTISTGTGYNLKWDNNGLYSNGYAQPLGTASNPWGTVTTSNNGGFSWLSGALGLWYQSASVMQISNSSTVSNALGSLACANVTASGQVFVPRAGATVANSIGWSGGITFIDGTGGMQYRDAGSGYATSFRWDNVGNVTASGTGTHTFGTTNTVTMAAGVLTASSKLVSGAGTVAAPSITVGDSATGLFKVATNQVGWSVNGSELVRFATGNILYCFGDITVYQDLIFQNAGRGIKLKAGTGARAGNATLAAGTVTVTNTTVTANTIIYLTSKTAGGTIGTLTYTLSAGASFTINSSSASDTSTISYLLVELNP